MKIQVYLLMEIKSAKLSRATAFLDWRPKLHNKPVDYFTKKNIAVHALSILISIQKNYDNLGTFWEHLGFNGITTPTLFFKAYWQTPKVIIEKSCGEVSLVEQDAIENVS